ncbi:MAG: type II toxin-antitoxin system mRNA interferase toxin, RelE/StbE family [Bacteroidales bacterium]|nr:type II toxin-antitoxin system mRNA interferase toxin, RelE/StbE family [Bacteroidales bacterium]
MREIIFTHQFKKDLKLAGFRECHIQPDWLLIYSKEDDGELHILNLVRTGTRSDLFKK